MEMGVSLILVGIIPVLIHLQSYLRTCISNYGMSLDEFENDDFIHDDLHDSEEDGPHIDDGKQKKIGKNRSTKNGVLDDDDCELIKERNLPFHRPTSESFTYEHVNFIFSDVTYPQDSIQSAINTNNYKFAYSEPGNFSYYDYCDAYSINGEMYENSGFTRQSENASTAANERSTAVPMQTDGHSTSNSHAHPAD
nr:hypothetical protein [Tanacetum cinerariifolium]